METERSTPEKDRLWPIGLTVALVLVVLVNLGFIYLAVGGSDDVDPAYVAGER